MPPKDQTTPTESQIEEQQQQDEAAQAAAGQQQQPDPESSEYEDTQLAAAMREAEMEKQGGDGESQTQQQPGEPGDGQQQQQPGAGDGQQQAPAATAGAGATGEGEGTGDGQQQAAGDDQQPVMLPKARFDQEVGRWRKTARDLETENAYLKGQLSVRTEQQQQGQQQQQAPEKTTAEKIADLRSEKADLYAKWEAGEIPTADRLAREGAIDDQIDEIKLEDFRAKIQPAQSPQGQQPVSDAYVEERNRQIWDNHPYLAHIGQVNPEADPVGAARWEALRVEAIAELRSEGQQIREGSQASDLLVRERVGVLSDKYGPVWTGLTPEQIRSGQQQQASAGTTAGQGQQQPGNQQQQGQQQPGQRQMSATAQARAAKLDVESRQPPDTSALGSPGSTTEVSEADIERMSEEEIMALPESVRRKFATM